MTRNVKKDELVFKGRLLRLYRRRTRLPNGNIVQLEMVKHPGAVLVVPFLSAGRIILLKQYRAVIGSYIWELPAGTLDKGEKPRECARRELVEETGYSAGSVRLLGSIVPVPGYSTEKIFIYEAKRLKAVERTPEADEVIETHVVTVRQLRGLLTDGEIVDAKTICALTLARIVS